MKIRLIILLLILIQFSYCQNQDLEKSHLIEIEGWKSYFDGNRTEAKSKFTKAIELDSTNYLAKIGLFNTKNESELNEADSGLIQRLPKKGNYNDIMLKLMMANQVDKELPDSIKVMRNKYDESHIKFKASLTDSEFKVYNENGDIRHTGAFKNRKPFGTWKKFGYQNKLHHSFTFSEETDTVVIRYYKPDGVVARKELTTGMPFTNESKKIKEIIYWQKTPGKNIDYLFVSKSGFTIFDSENSVVFDESTPDNIIQITHNPKTHDLDAFIWKNGNKEPFEYCPYDGTTVTYTENGEKKSFRWENCKKIPIEK
ncbi:hypothetical protein Q4Q35_02165 [Flavivirga aquimarina]|uniref:Tetratricopeptide repeat protein n=1 Tax=Flavivirga aquimarina TaxID=2027862 RepID=A0ABT8W666_9FLAO|nr:hypothetical protein [Flavivirga aquimarina]MDO5968601.1 hypothetical protein [Flavivirga aquimarina]